MSCQSCQGCCAPAPKQSAPSQPAHLPADSKLVVVTVDDTSKFDATVATYADKLKADKSFKLLVSVCGAVDAATGVSWCSDCRQADPVMMKVLGALDNAVLINCPVDRATYKGNPDHPYRKHRQLQLKAVPTLYLWGKNGPLRSLVEEQLFTAEAIEALLEP